MTQPESARAARWPLLPSAESTVLVPDTAVVRLRAWHPRDAPALAAAWTDPAIARFLRPPADLTEAAARRWIAGDAARRRAARSLDLVVDRAGVVAGEVGLSAFDPRRRAALVGYWVGESHRGRGLAAAALAALGDWAFAHLGVQALLAQCDPDNAASQATARRAGYRLLAPDHQGWAVWARLAGTHGAVPR